METLEKTKEPINTLVCFTDSETGKAMSETAAYLTMSGSEHSSLTFLHLTNENLDNEQPVSDEKYQSKAFKELLSRENKSKITVRTFIKKTENNVAEIRNALKEQNINLLIFGVSSNVLTPALCRKYGTLKSDPTLSDSDIKFELQNEEWNMLSNLVDLFSMNSVTTCLFINNNLQYLNNFFISILSSSDVQILPTAITRLMRKENTEYMIWDAIGSMENNLKLQKFYNSFQKLTEDKVSLWDNDKKIDIDFIKKQDLCIFGFDGWNKLVKTNLPWIESLPSTLIIKIKSI